MPSTPSPKTPWTKEELDQAWQQLDMRVQPILILLARRPDGYPLEDLVELCSSEPRHILGLLGQVNRLHKQHRGKPRLFRSDRKSCCFTMDLEVAALISTQDDRWVPL